ncbi:MAG: transporter [Chitinophagaceae bacterium]|nr:transporter [Chitinophagaceae bacterium]
MKQFKIIFFLLFITHQLFAQTDIDAIMMEKNAFCVGPMYSYSSWKNYWEGTFKRDNQNLGTVTTQMFSVMGNYGVSQKLNLLFNVPYVTTKASAGQLRGMRGLQDLSLMVKYRPINKKIGYARLAVYGIGGISTPLTNYVADYLPLAIGLKSKTAMVRLMVDYYYNNKWFVTASGTYVFRDNITLDRNSYYTTELVLSNKVFMPNVATFNIRAGWRTQYLIAEAVFNNITTQGGFDITKNDMPFPSNRMNASSIGANFKYVFKKKDHLSLTGGAHQVIAGRNMGQSLNLNFGVFYVIDVGKKEKKDK